MKCAYCDDNKGKITREHVVSKAFLEKYYKAGKGYANVYDSYTHNLLTARDVCSKCNNGILSKLDNYFLEFYGNNIPEQQIITDSQIDIYYNFEKLSKWLLKTLYNSERKNAYLNLPKKMHKYKQYILGKDNRTKLFKIYLELLQDIPKSEVVKLAKYPEDKIPDKLSFLRIGNVVFSNQLTTGVVNTIKHITTSNFIFHIFILDIGQHSQKSFLSLLKEYLEISKVNRLFFLDPNIQHIRLRASNRTIIDTIENSYEGGKSAIERLRENSYENIKK